VSCLKCWQIYRLDSAVPYYHLSSILGGFWHIIPPFVLNSCCGSLQCSCSICALSSPPPPLFFGGGCKPALCVRITAIILCSYSPVNYDCRMLPLMMSQMILLMSKVTQLYTSDLLVGRYYGMMEAGQRKTSLSSFKRTGIKLLRKLCSNLQSRKSCD